MSRASTSADGGRPRFPDASLRRAHSLRVIFFTRTNRGSPVTYQEVIVSTSESVDFRRSVAELARDFEQPLQELAAALCGNAPDGHDLVQETFERVARTRPAQLPRQNRRAWLFAVLSVASSSTSIAETVRAPQRVELDLALVAEPEREPPPPAWRDLTAGDVHDAFARTLDEPFAVAFCMHALEGGKSYGDISAPSRHVGLHRQRHILRARPRLRRRPRRAAVRARSIDAAPALRVSRPIVRSVLVALALGVCGCHGRVAAKAPAPPRVVAAAPASDVVPAPPIGPGYLGVVIGDVVDIAAPLDARVEALLVRVGDRVTRDQPLARLDRAALEKRINGWRSTAAWPPLASPRATRGRSSCAWRANAPSAAPRPSRSRAAPSVLASDEERSTAQCRSRARRRAPARRARRARRAQRPRRAAARARPWKPAARARRRRGRRAAGRRRRAGRRGAPITAPALRW